ncbi:MAG: GNAT family N-acetyltransferase [Flaviflexus sp.]|nr:GNAT family N-acetyltransferase [Flaviflexus sp.]
MREPLTDSHLNDLAALVARIEEHDSAPYRTLPVELAEYFTSTSQVVGFWSDDTLIGYGAVRDPGEGLALRCSGGIDPDHRLAGLGDRIVQWFIQAARELGQDRDEATMEIHVDEGNEDLRDILLRRGFAPAGGYVQMRRDLSRPRPKVELPSFFAMEAWDSVQNTDIGRAYSDVFAGQGWEPNEEFFIPEWSFIVVDKRTDRTKLAGFLMSNKYEQDWQGVGWSEGYTETIGVLPEYRGLALATNLLNRAADAYAESGMEYAGLDVNVDEDGQAELLALFTACEYQPVWHTDIYRRSID